MTKGFQAILTVSLCLLLLITGCTNKNSLQSIPANEIPAYAKEGDYQFVACEYKGDDVSGKKVTMYLVAAFRDGQAVHSVTRDLAGVEAFGGSAGSSMKDVNGTLIHGLQASGVAFDSRVDKIVGSTTTGRRLETKPVNGYWLMIFDNTEPNEKWTEVAALNGARRVVYRLDNVKK